MTQILPSEDHQIQAISLNIVAHSTIKKQWSTWHQRLHGQIIANKGLLPYRASLVLAISGGQDSMALVRLLNDLQHIYEWELHLWHGNHRWRPDSDQVANELAEWASEEKLSLCVSIPNRVLDSESIARQWRYECLINQAKRLGCEKIITAHTASDRAETLLLNISRGSDRHGMASLPNSRHFLYIDNVNLIRPLLNFSRQDTAAICQEWKLPIWYDHTNENLSFSRNRIRHRVLPILEELHPGASLRISALSSRLQEENQTLSELLPLAIRSLTKPRDRHQLLRTELVSLSKSNQRHVLYEWIRRECNLNIKTSVLEQLINRLPLSQGPGKLYLAAGWILSWNRKYIVLDPNN
uniref:tRNA(Ile)-lysidine synthase n=1 Tax=Paulinella micropora TaxID=1928728 RepID=A0A385I0C6_9EUKA|nr:putative MesJ-like protein [Paulinella micropora]AXY63383.1 putative MesJ-like protein [Paulinella micropora]